MSKYKNVVYSVSDAVFEIVKGDAIIEDFHVTDFDRYELYEFSDMEMSALKNNNDLVVVKRVKVE